MPSGHKREASKVIYTSNQTLLTLLSIAMIQISKGKGSQKILPNCDDSATCVGLRGLV